MNMYHKNSHMNTQLIRKENEKLNTFFTLNVLINVYIQKKMKYNVIDI